MYSNRPNHNTERPIRYTSILRTARLQMSRVRINDSAPSSPLSDTSTNSSSSMDCEMDDLHDHSTTAANKNLLQQSPQSLPTTTLFHRPAKPPANTAISGRAVGSDDERIGADRTPVCICLTCERAAAEAEAAAALHVQLSSLASAQRFDRGAVGYAR